SEPPPPVVVASSAPAVGPAPSASAAPPPPAPAACPADMVLVSGDYCTAVTHRCLVEWYAPQNKKEICEEFAPEAKCVGRRVPKRYCIDRYEYPNEKGVRPEIMNAFNQAQVKCAARGKRLCTESEWTFACEGPEMKPFPYGYVRDPRKCNGDHQWDNASLAKMVKRDPVELARLWKGVPSGSQPECVSDFGVADLPANTDEVVANDSPTAKHSAVQTGGPWYSGVRNQCRPKIYTHGEETFGYFLSFRCCTEADGAPVEPRTAKQQKDGVSWARIEELAGFGVEEMKGVNEKRARGECRCEASDIRCKTMCGTTLGPGAVDGSDATRVLHPKRQELGAHGP
ncbi:MAG: SUMF1/EgtB/PvdO family nonheme iron enzyme, partial [Myxococcales bacterium]|nr:SUMF1/EgtB/PvdO family nonheme iron enzyme [Myxococcales bacterium]